MTEEKLKLLKELQDEKTNEDNKKLFETHKEEFLEWHKNKNAESVDAEKNTNEITSKEIALQEEIRQLKARLDNRELEMPQGIKPDSIKKEQKKYTSKEDVIQKMKEEFAKK
ncbi:MAG: hypothetical protein HRS57_02760 [Mycoplasmataceae bacterium]|nr:hypothetical protein [Mycoplasmataceae bacterium]